MKQDQDNIVKIDSVMKDLMPTFMERRRNEIPEMEDLFSHDDFEGLIHFGHKLKGTSLNYHFDRLAFLASQLEIAAQNKDKSQIRNLIDQISFHTKNVKIVFDEP